MGLSPIAADIPNFNGRTDGAQAEVKPPKGGKLSVSGSRWGGDSESSVAMPRNLKIG